MVTVTMTKGLPGSGKSTWAKEVIKKHPNTYKRVNKDDLRAMLDNSKHSEDSEKFILNVRDSIITMAIEGGKHVIVDDCNLGSKHEPRIRQLIQGKATLVIKDFTDVPLETCIKNDLNRDKSVGERVIKKMYNQFLRPKPIRIEHIDGLPSAVICDLDGTLALMNDRNPYDASTCDQDDLNPHVASLLEGKRVILLSGREDKYREPTIKFLNKHGIIYENLYMRATGDMRKDSIVKEELFNAHIRGQYNIEYVLDDRLQVCQKWYELGLPLLRVGDPDADF
jgi:predicted kinase